MCNNIPNLRIIQRVISSLSRKRTCKNTHWWKAKQSTFCIVWWRLIFAIFNFGRLDFDRDPGLILPLNIHFWVAQHVHKTRLHPKQIEYDVKLHDGKNYRSSTGSYFFTAKLNGFTNSFFLIASQLFLKIKSSYLQDNEGKLSTM